MNGNQLALWYAAQIKPWFAPEPWVFGVAWGVIYPLMIVSFGYVLYQVVIGKWSWPIIFPFVLNVIFNLAFTPLQAYTKSNMILSIDIVLVLLTLTVALVTVWQYARWVVYINVPYLAWGLFATTLQLTLWWVNG